jgi:hypothetical protein
LIIVGIILVGTLLFGIVLSVEQSRSTSGIHSIVLKAPITHKPTYLGSYPFILGSGNLLQNGTAYSYVRINASAIEDGDSFVAHPALNVGLAGSGVDEDNFTVKITYHGSAYGSSPYWINFSSFVPLFNTSANSSQIGIEGSYSRTSFPLPGLKGVEYFVQVSNVVGENNEFEYFFYIGNSSTPIPELTHGPVR